ncbi:MAG: caspase family protein [Acidobacteria bacterium]|nr:caspase family protein [Acidobacteriota bacterium]
MSESFNNGHALIIGVGADLPNTVDDAKGIAAILRNSSRCAYPKEQVHLLTGAKAKRQNILEALENLSQVTKDSSVIVYFSGHGCRSDKGGQAAHYLMPYGYDVADLAGTAISGSEFAAGLSKIKSERLLVLLDCCHAGGFAGAQAQTPEAKSPRTALLAKAPLPPEAQKIFKSRKGRVIIASSTGSEVSYAGEPYSAFTTALIAALCGERTAQEDGYVRVVDLALYTHQAVLKLTEDRQHSMMDFEEADNFVVAYYAGGKKKRKALPASVKNTKIETHPGSNEFRVFDQRNWTVLRDVINIHGDQYNYYGNTTNIRAERIGFYQPGWNVGSVTQIQEGNQELQRRGTGRKRR